MLFSPDQVGSKEDEFDASEAIKDAYETVNEGMTTDTTSAVDEDDLMTRSSAVGTTKVPQVSKSKKMVDEGIKSSDDDDEDLSEDDGTTL